MNLYDFLKLSHGPMAGWVFNQYFWIFMASPYPIISRLSSSGRHRDLSCSQHVSFVAALNHHWHFLCRIMLHMLPNLFWIRHSAVDFFVGSHKTQYIFFLKNSFFWCDCACFGPVNHMAIRIRHTLCIVARIASKIMKAGFFIFVKSED